MSVTHLETVATLACMLCGRVIGEVVDGRIRVKNPEHLETARRLTCPHCRGRLLISDIDVVWVVDRSAIPADAAPKRDRPKGPSTPCATCGTTARWAGRRLCHACMVKENKMLPCSNCLVNPRMSDRQHCQPCRSARRKANGWVS